MSIARHLLAALIVFGAGGAVAQPADKARIKFVAGLTSGRHALLTFAAGFFGLMCLVPLVAFLYTGEWGVLWTLIGCLALAYPLWKNVERNRPRIYNPDQLPPELVP